MGLVNCDHFVDELKYRVQEGSSSGCSRRAAAGKLGRTTTDTDDHDDSKFKSKNLEAERRRRERIKDRLLKLRASVPVITNMNKDTIITDAITYIEDLQRQVKGLGGQLLDFDALPEEEGEPQAYDNKDAKATAAEEKLNIEPQVNVIRLADKKLWVKVIYESGTNHRVFTKMVEGLNELGYELNDISLTTARGATVLSASLEGMYGPSNDCSEEEMKKRLLDVMTKM